MQNWYNGLTKGQRIIIAVTMSITLWMIGLICIHKTIGVIMEYYWSNSFYIP